MDMRFAYDLSSRLSEARRSILSYPPFTPQIPTVLNGQDKIMRLVQHQDLLLSYPYESMEPFL
jgi:polyphosphate kinase